jgi:nifR3 family TIM-barrel protein
MGKEPDFFVGNIPIFGKTILAPMDGYSDSPFRSITRQLGSAMSYTEFINTIDIIHPHPRLHERIDYQESERPLVFQILGNNAQDIVASAKILLEYKPDMIDVNMGCPARSVSTRGAGAGLLKQPALVEEIIRQLTHEIDIPITAKIRTGWDDSAKNYLEIARIIEGSGGALIAVHARTRAQAYTGKADWSSIAEIKQAVKIPVIANGDVSTVKDIAEISASTNADGVMIGRAATGNPWIFSGMDRGQVLDEVVLQTVKTHLQMNMDFYGPEKGLVLFRKFARAYLVPYSMDRDTRQSLLTSSSPDEFLQMAEKIIG